MVQNSTKLHADKLLSISPANNGAAGVVVSCKIPILATRVRFPGGARVFLFSSERDCKAHLKINHFMPLTFDINI